MEAQVPTHPRVALCPTAPHASPRRVFAAPFLSDLSVSSGAFPALLPASGFTALLGRVSRPTGPPSCQASRAHRAHFPSESVPPLEWRVTRAEAAQSQGPSRVPVELPLTAAGRPSLRASAPRGCWRPAASQGSTLVHEVSLLPVECVDKTG